MKRKVIVGATVWVLFITLLHVQLNVGWGRLAHGIQVFLGSARKELVVGFLPVT